MTCIKNFFVELKDSFYNPSLYSKVVTEPTSKRIWFLAKVSVVGWVLFAIVALAYGIPALIAFSKSNFVEQQYPDDLVVTIDDGIVSVNQEVPYFIPAIFDEETGPANLLVIDTNPDISMDTMEGYDTLAVITSDSFVMFKSESETRIFSLADAGDFEMTKEKAIQWGEIALKWTYIFIIPVVIILIAVMSGFILAYYLVASFAIALVTLVVSKIWKKKLTYKNAYKVTLLALAPVLAIDMVITSFGLFTFGFLDYLILVTIVIALNFANQKTETIETIASPDTEGEV